MTAASMESCRFAARRSPRGRFWSAVDVRKRLQRVRDPFHQSINIKQGAQPVNQLAPARHARRVRFTDKVFSSQRSGGCFRQ